MYVDFLPQGDSSQAHNFWLEFMHNLFLSSCFLPLIDYSNTWLGFYNECYF